MLSPDVMADLRGRLLLLTLLFMSVGSSLGLAPYLKSDGPESAQTVGETIYNTRGLLGSGEISSRNGFVSLCIIAKSRAFFLIIYW